MSLWKELTEVVGRGTSPVGSCPASWRHNRTFNLPKRTSRSCLLFDLSLSGVVSFSEVPLDQVCIFAVDLYTKSLLCSGEGMGNGSLNTDVWHLGSFVSAFLNLMRFRSKKSLMLPLFLSLFLDMTSENIFYHFRRAKVLMGSFFWGAIGTRNKKIVIRKSVFLKTQVFYSRFSREEKWFHFFRK